MEQFKYYKRGKGELDTSNFKTIALTLRLKVSTLDEKTFTSLLALNHYMQITENSGTIRVVVEGYVAHLRADKDEYSPANLYLMLDRMEIDCLSVQHESTAKIKSATVDKLRVLEDLDRLSPWFTLFIGADGSVPKFFPDVDICARKVRENGKVTDMAFSMPETSQAKQIIIVDDLLGGGATIQMLVDIIKASGFAGPIHMWVAYNEGFHTQEFLDQFASYNIGETV